MSDIGEEHSSVLGILQEWGFLTSDQRTEIREAAKKSQKSEEEIIASEHMVPEEQLYRAKGKYLGVPYIDLSSRGDIDPEAVRVIPTDVSRTYGLVAFAKDDRTLHVAMSRPDDFQALEALKFLTKKTGLSTEVHIASESGVSEALTKLSGGLSGEVETAIRQFNEEIEGAGDVVKDRGNEVERIVGDAPVTKAVAVILRHAIDGDASDIHIEPGKDNVRVRFRVAGSMYTSLMLPTRVHSSLVSRIKILATLKIDEQRLPQDGRFSTMAAGHEYDVRVSVMPTKFGEKVVMRILDKSQGAIPFETLGYFGTRLKSLKEALHRPHGLILITGPTGSGKSTTLFTALDSITTSSVNAITLEDPVEYHIEGASQTQINPDIGFTFAKGLRSALRQDPDIVMVGEIRDMETASLVVHAALTGHLVLSTLHTNDAIGAIPRLVDMGLEPFLLSAVLRLVGAQRLVKQVCEHCRQEIPIPMEFREIIENEMKKIPEHEKVVANQKNPQVLYEGKGCNQCGDSGTTGRMAIVEAFTVNEKLREAIIRQVSYDDLAEIVRQEGELSIRQDGFLKALAGSVRFEDVLEVTSND